ncbi:hypothetical protein B0H13DRAFT_1930215 [Mycena leptocephala]|nr:hypothetical protein B0H13DRAFT_1930215 [Mycena leptocephala]
MRISMRLSPRFTAGPCLATDNDGGTLVRNVALGLVCVYPGVDCSYIASNDTFNLSLDASARCPNSLAQSSITHQCQPTDNDGGTLATNVASLVCIYPDIDCFYFPSVPKFQFNGHYPKSEFGNHRIRNVFNPPRHCRRLGIDHRITLPLKSRHRAVRIGAIKINQQASTISPFTLITEMGDVNNDGPSDTRSTGASTIARRQLQTQLHAVQEKMVNLEDIERRTSSGSSDGSGRHRILRLMRTASNRGSPEVHAELQAAKEQINVLVERMNALEANANWAHGEGISDDPPPNYV